VKGAEAKKLALTDVVGFNSTTGKGVKGTVSGKQVAVGNTELFHDLSVDPAPLLDQAETLRKEGQTVMLVAVDGKAAGIVGVADPIKESTPDAIRELRAAGLKIIMVTETTLRRPRQSPISSASNFMPTYCRKRKQR